MHVTTLETIGHLDFEPETPCEYSRHAQKPSHAADLLIRSTCIACSDAVVLGICLNVWHQARRRELICRDCGAVMTRDEAWKVLEVLS
jgi:hypothetical protein